MCSDYLIEITQELRSIADLACIHYNSAIATSGKEGDFVGILQL